MRKEFAVPLSRPNHLWRREGAVCMFVCFRPACDPGVLGSYKGVDKGKTGISVLSANPRIAVRSR